MILTVDDTYRTPKEPNLNLILLQPFTVDLSAEQNINELFHYIHKDLFKVITANSGHTPSPCFYEHLCNSANMWLIWHQNTSCSQPIMCQHILPDVIQVQMRIFSVVFPPAHTHKHSHNELHITMSSSLQQNSDSQTS